MTKKMTIELPDGVKVRISNMEYDALTSLYFDTPEAADELIKRVEAAKEKRPAGMPEDGQEYPFITEYGFIDHSIWDDTDGRHTARWNLGNVPLNAQAGLREIERRKALQRVKAWIAENTEPSGSFKQSFIMRHENGHLEADNYGDNRCIVGYSLPYLHPREAADLIESCESDLRVLAGVE